MASQLTCKHAHVQFVIQRSGTKRWVYSTCMDCVTEWTVTEEVADLADTVTADEIIEVHEQLDSQALADLFGKGDRS